MRDHIHTGFVATVYAGLSAIVVINVWRIVAAKVAGSANPSLAKLGAAAGALVHFGA